MFWKIVGGIMAFLMAIVLVVALLVTAAAAVAGAAVGTIVENFDATTVAVTDADGNTETYDLNDLISEAGLVEVTGENGERVTIDIGVPQITVEESGAGAARVVIGSGTGLEVNASVPNIRINGRNIDNFDGGLFLRPVVWFFRGLFNLTLLGLMAGGLWLLLRKRQPAVNTPQEKTTNATA